MSSSMSLTFVFIKKHVLISEQFKIRNKIIYINYVLEKK